jgi:cytochrome c oxidase subunit 1
MVCAMIIMNISGIVLWLYYLIFFITEGSSDIEIHAYFMAAIMIIAAPAGIKIFSWLATLWGANIILATPMLFALGFIIMFIIGGLTGVAVVNARFDVGLHDPYFVVLHYQHLISHLILLAFFAGFYCWLKEITGKIYLEKLGKLHFWLFFIGTSMTSLPMYFLNVAGLFSWHTITNLITPQEWGILTSIGSTITIISYFLFIYIIYETITNTKPRDLFSIANNKQETKESV